MRKTGSIIILLLLLFQLLIVFVPPETNVIQNARASLTPSSGWQYYKQISLSNPRKNYQIQIHLVVGSGTDNTSNNTIYIPFGYCENFPNDVRFASTNDPSTAVQLPQWLEYNTTTEAWYWINTTSANYSTIYLFVGNSNATLYSDGNATFVFFDDFDVFNASLWEEFDPNNVATVSCEDSLLHIAIGGVGSGSTAGVDSTSALASIEHSLLVGKVKGETLSNSYNQPFNMIAKVDNDNYTKNRYRKSDKYKFYVEQNNVWYQHQISTDSYITGTWVTLYTKMMGNIHKAGVFYEHYNGDRIGTEVSDNHSLSGQFYISLNQRTYDSGMDGYWDYIFVANYSEPETRIQSTGEWKSASNNPPTISNEYPTNGATDVELEPWCHIDVNDPDGDTMTLYWYSGGQGDISNIYKFPYTFSDGREDRYGAIDTKRHIILAVGGQDESYNYYDDVEIFNLSDPSTPQVVANLTHTTSKAGVVYDPYNDCFYVYGARISGTTYSDKIHKIDADDYDVTVLTEHLPSGIRSARAVAFSTKQKCAYLLMGTTTSGDYKGQIWRHNPNNHTFLYTGASIDYDYTESGLAIYVPEQDCIYFFGGRPNYWENKFIWRFNCTTETVTNLSATNNVYAPYGAEGWGGYYNTDNQWIYIFAGDRNETSPYYTNQIWKFSPFNYSVTTLSITMPKAQDDFFAVYSPYYHKGYLISCIPAGAGDNAISQQKYLYSVNYSLSFTLQQINTSVTNGTYYWHYTEANQSNKTYWWKVAVNDGTYNITSTYSFTTSSNSPPTQSNPSPSDGATDVDVSLSQLSIDISDPEGDLMDWSIETSPNIGSASGNNVGNGTITCPVSGLSYGTTYTWYVNVTDGNSWNNQSYTFTTETNPNLAITFGSEYVFRSAETTCTSVDNLTSNKFVVAYGNSSFQAVRIGEVSGTTISWGPEYTFSPCTYGISVTALDSTHIVVARKGESEKGIAVVGEVSGNTISFGSEVVFHDGALYSSPEIDALDGSHVVIAFNDKDYSRVGKCIIGTVSGISISFGSEYTFNNDATYDISVSSLTSSKFVVAYKDGGNSHYGTAIIGTVSDSSISYGSEYTFNSGITGFTSVSALTSTKFVIAYRDDDNNYYGTAIIGTVSGTTITFGSEYVFNSAATDYTSTTKLTSDRFEVAYRDGGNSGYGTAIIGTVSGNTITFGSEYVFNSGDTRRISTSALTSYKFVITYKDDSNSDYGTAIIGQLPAPPTISNPQPANNSANVPVTLSQLSVEISDPDGGLMNWTIETSPNIGSSSGNNAGNGTIICPVSNLTYGTTYTWYVNVTDGNFWTNKTYTFTTTTPQPPSNLKATSINTTTISLTWTKSPDTDVTVVVRKEGSYPTSPSDGTVIYNGTAESYVDSNLSPGTAYYYRAWSYAPNSYSSSYTQDMNYTYPSKPTSISSSATGYTISLYWNRGDGADYTVIRYSTSVYPTSPSEGTFAYNDTGTSTTVTGLNPNTTYYFSLWAYDSESGFYSQDYAICMDTTLDVPPDPSNLVATPVNTTAISLSWDADTNYRSVLVRKTTGYPTSPTDGVIVYNGTGASYVDTGLSISTHYYYAVWTYKEYSHLYSEGHAQDDAWTYPQPPQDVDYTLESSGTTANLTITWTKGQGADKTVIRKSANSFPSSPSDGILVYNGTGESYTDVNIDQMWYYRLWSYNEESGLYSEGVNLTFFACWLNCYNETTGEAISNWSVFISDMNGSQVYTAENLQNSHILNSSQLPQGLVSFKFTADGYKFRLYYYEITSEKSLTINAYLPPESANLYMLYVKDVFGSPVRGALISVRHYNPASDTYVEVARLYTDAEGRAGVYLVPGDMYKIVISKEGYQTGHSDFTPLAELYTAEFTLLGSGEGGELPEGLWDNITLSIRPSQTHFNESTNLTVYFNISCPTGEIEWYRIEVYKIRNLTQTETLLYSKSESNPYGGNLSYNIGSEVGTYKVVCTFKKQNFSAVSFERDYYIYEEKLPSMSIIPPHVYVIILIFLALAAMAFLMRLGAGDLSPIAGIIVFIIGFLIYPVTIAGVSCWYLVIAMGIGYGAYMLVRSGV